MYILKPIGFTNFKARQENQTGKTFELKELSITCLLLDSQVVVTILCDSVIL